MNRHLRLILVLALCAVGVVLIIIGQLGEYGTVEDEEVFAIDLTDNFTHSPEGEKLHEYIEASGIPDREFIPDTYDCEDFAYDMTEYSINRTLHELYSIPEVYQLWMRWHEELPAASENWSREEYAVEFAEDHIEYKIGLAFTINRIEKRYHITNFIVIGNRVYRIEPQNGNIYSHWYGVWVVVDREEEG